MKKPETPEIIDDKYKILILQKDDYDKEHGHELEQGLIDPYDYYSKKRIKKLMDKAYTRAFVKTFGYHPF